ncbi:MAG TPA: DUF4233 domain-containing protein [Nocardioides sp.]
MSRRERAEVEQRVIPAGAFDDPERFKSPRRGMAAAVLVLEAIIIGLSAPVMVRFTDIAPGIAIGLGVGLAVACVLTAGLLRREWGYVVGWVLQVAAIGLGFLAPAMFFLGAVFGALWATADLMGRKIERERGAAWAEYDATHPDGPAPATPAAPSED